MEPLALLHQAALFGHTMAFAITVSAVLREDLRLLVRRRFDPAQLQRTMRVVGAGLLVLWMTGLVLVAIAAATDPAPWAPSAKLGAKLVVVTLLSLNGWALHAWVFPRLPAGTLSWRADLRLPAVLGAFSTASWVYAVFVGVARPLSAVLSFAGFMALYGAAVVTALIVARVLFARPPARAEPAAG